MKNPCTTALIGLACVTALVAMPASAASLAKLVPSQSQIVFVTRQMGAPVQGVFKKFDVQIALDPQKPEGGTIKVLIDTASATLGVPIADAELPKESWFDAARFPQATFQSNTVKALGGGKFEVTGQLSIKGSTHTVRVPATIVQPQMGYSVVTGNFTIQRLSYRIGDEAWNDTSLIANDVQVRFKLTLTGLDAL